MKTQEIINAWENGIEPYTINEKLDQLFPVTCIVCENAMQRCAPSYPVCYRCGLDQTSAEAYAIQRLKPSYA